MGTNEEDFPERLVSMKTHDFILFFSNFGKVYRLKGYEVPKFNRQSKGLPIVNLLPIEKEEKITSAIVVNQENEEAKYLAFITKKGLIKRTALSEFDSIRNNGKKAIVFKEDDELIAVHKTNGDNEIIIGSSDGRLVRFHETEVRIMGRSSSGVKGISCDDSVVVGAEVVENNSQVLVVTENGYGKRTNIEEYRLTHRGSKGVKTLNITDKNGAIVALRAVTGDEDLMIITNTGIVIRILIAQVSLLSRNTQGVRLINLKNDQKVATANTVQHLEEEIVEE